MAFRVLRTKPEIAFAIRDDRRPKAASRSAHEPMRRHSSAVWGIASFGNGQFSGVGVIASAAAFFACRAATPRLLIRRMCSRSTVLLSLG